MGNGLKEGLKWTEEHIYGRDVREFKQEYIYIGVLKEFPSFSQVRFG